MANEIAALNSIPIDNISVFNGIPIGSIAAINGVNSQIQYTLSVDQSSVYINSTTGAACDGYSLDIYITTQAGNAWTATRGATWFRINGSSSPVSGIGSGIISVSLFVLDGNASSSISITSDASTVNVSISKTSSCGF